MNCRVLLLVIGALAVFLSFSSNLVPIWQTQAAAITEIENHLFILRGTFYGNDGAHTVWFTSQKSQGSSSSKFELMIDGNSAPIYLKFIEGGLVKTESNVEPAGINLPLVQGSSMLMGSDVRVRYFVNESGSGAFFSRIELFPGNGQPAMVWDGSQPGGGLSLVGNPTLRACMNGCGYASSTQYPTCMRTCIESYGGTN